MKATLYRAALSYPHLQLYTASSGGIAALDELYLLLEDQQWRGIGEVRINIDYLNGYTAQQVLNDVMACLRRFDTRQDAGQLLANLDIWAAGCLAPTRMLLDTALLDLVAQRQRQSVAQMLMDTAAKAPIAQRQHHNAARKSAGSPPDNLVVQQRHAIPAQAYPSAPLSYHTNQTLFWSSNQQMLAQAEAYVERGFTELKLRVAVAGFEEDVARIKALRRRFGAAISLALDANGQWPAQEAAARLQALAHLDIRYMEQPIAPGDADHPHYGYAALARSSPIPLMLDESMSSEADLQRIIALEGKVWAHIKLVKMGGIGPAFHAARRLSNAGVPFMVGQMNEGAAATAAALHVACASHPAHAELYGADGLGNDPVSGLFYHQGRVSSPNSYGLGVSFDPARAHCLQEFLS